MDTLCANEGSVFSSCWWESPIERYNWCISLSIVRARFNLPIPLCFCLDAALQLTATCSALWLIVHHGVRSSLLTNSRETIPHSPCIGQRMAPTMPAFATGCPATLSSSLATLITPCYSVPTSLTRSIGRCQNGIAALHCTTVCSIRGFLSTRSSF